MAVVEVLSVRVAVCGCPDAEKLICAGLNVLLPGGVPKEANVTVPVKPFWGVRVRS